jgi:hypothetical protein
MRLLSTLRSWTAWDERGARMVPPRITGAVIGCALTFPISAGAAIGTDQYIGLIWHACLLVTCIAHAHLQRRLYLLGVEDGREELLEEVLDAWHEHGVTPGEYLSREYYFAEYADEARQQVQRAGRPKKRNTP